MTINPKTLRHRRDQLGLTLDKLAEISKVDRQTIHRIERGLRSDVRANTLDKLANALRWKPEDLQREPAEAPSIDRPHGELSPVSHRIDPAIKNAYWLVAERYGVSEADIVRLAPLLFALVAEDSLVARQKRINEWWNHLEKADNVALRFGYLPLADVLATIGERDDARSAENCSIAAKDIFGEHACDRPNMAFLNDLPEDYSAGTHNPFVAFLRDYAGRFTQVASVESVERGDAQYTLFDDRLLELACEDDQALNALRWGIVALHDFPKDLLDPARRDDRLVWLRPRVEEAKRLADEALLDLL